MIPKSVKRFSEKIMLRLQTGGLRLLVIGEFPARSLLYDAAALKHMVALHQRERAADVLLTMSL